MRKIVLATLVALMVSLVSPVYSANAQSCSDVTGGNVTFTVCSGYSVDHFWSSTKIKVNWFNSVGASLTITNENGNFSKTDNFYIGESKTYNVETRPVDHAYSRTMWVKVKYAGNDSTNTGKALIKVESNATYEDSKYVKASNALLSAPNVSVSNVYTTNGSEYVDVTWDAVTGATDYYVDIEVKKPGSSIYELYNYTLGAGGTKYTQKIDDAGSYRVRVQGYKTGETSWSNSNPWSEWKYFTVEPEQEALATPTGLAYTVYTNNGSRYVDLAWDSVSNAYGYEVRLEPKDSSGNYSNDNDYSYNTYTNSLGSNIATGDYRFRVKAYDSANNESSWSEWTYFTVSPLVAPTSVSISSPYPAAYDTSINLVNFDWSDVSTANKYYTYVEMEQNGSYTYMYDKLIYAYEGSYLNGYPIYNPNNYYRVKVAALDAYENYGDWSDWYYFTDNSSSGDTTAPTVYIDTNKTSYNYNETIEISATAYDDVEVSQIDLWVVQGNVAGKMKSCYNTSYCSYSHGPFAVPDSTQTFEFYAVAWDSSNNSAGSESIYRTVSNDVYYNDLTTPVINYPYNNSNYFSNSADFSWDSVYGAGGYEFEVEYSDNGSWTSYYYLKTGDTYLNYLNLSKFGYYRVHVRAHNNAGTSSYSDYVYFDYLQYSNPVVLETPVITFPANNQMIYHNLSDYFDYGDNLPERKLDTTWNEVTDADYYNISYELKDGSGNWVYFSNFNVYGTTDFLYGWLSTGEYRVKIKAMDNNSAESDWSGWTYFEIYDHENLSMNDSTDGDGLYTVLKGNSITHIPTGIKATVENVDHAVVYLRLENADKDLIYIRKGQPYWAENSAGVKIYFDYVNIDKDGIDINIYTDYVTDVVYANDAKRISDLKQIQTALELYYTDNGNYPASYGAAVLGDSSHECFNSNGWSSTGCSNPYMGNVPADPGTNNYIYIQWANTYIIISTFEGTIDGLSGNVYATPSGISNYFNI